MMDARRQGRCWRFGQAILDEDSWTLSVDGVPVAIETKPLELLHELLLHAGQVVTKGELLDAVWPQISVVEASLPTAVSKLRRALGNELHAIETVQRLGYRLTAPVEMTMGPRDATSALPQARARPFITLPRGRWSAIAAGLAIVLAAGVVVFPKITHTTATPAPAFTQRDVHEAIRHLDVERIEGLLRGGWNPNTLMDDQGNGAMTFVLNICEWNPGHDKQRLLLMARTLMEAGVRVDQYNKWGDTPYSIAKAKRYCGPDHPVTKMMYASCYNGLNPPKDKCLATYDPGRRKRS